MTKKVKLAKHVDNNTEYIDILANSQKPLQELFAVQIDDPVYVDSGCTFLCDTFDGHAFIECVLMCYNSHIDLCISPDHIWMLICQGIATHFKHRPHLRSQMFMKHFGNKHLFIQGDSFETCIKNSIDNLAEHINNHEFLKAMEHDFSTTTDTVRTAGKVTALSLLKKNYFMSYSLSCGIPNVILEGTEEDWERLIEKLNILSERIGLKWWFQRLAYILGKLLETYKGNVDEVFWSKIITSHNTWGSDGDITGWIMVFFPYVEKTKRNTVCLPDGKVVLGFLDKVAETESGNVEIGQEFVAGFMGYIVNTEAGYISPNIGWYVREIINELGWVRNEDDTEYLEADKKKVKRKKCCIIS
jgi:hypothetical protein